VTDRETKVEVDLLPGGISDKPQILTLEMLISSKLSTYMGRGIDRVQDYADVARLMQANHPPRDYLVDPEVQDLYQKIWDEIHKSA
jgi:hypothetical protein